MLTRIISLIISTVVGIIFVNAYAGLAEYKKIPSLASTLKITGYSSIILDFVTTISQIFLPVLGIFLFIVSAILNLTYMIFTFICICNEDKGYHDSEKSLKTDLLLCTFLGFLGIHRFYEGKIGTGILWLLTFGCLGIGVTIDMYQMLMVNRYDSNGNHICRFNARKPAEPQA